MPHLQDSIHKLPVWGTMQRYIPTPTRLNEQVAGVGDYATQMPHLQDSLNKSPVYVGDYATTSCRYGMGDYATPMPHLQDLINKSPVRGTMQHHYIPTPARLHEQVAGTGDYATQMPHLQDSINKSPVWGTMQHQCHTYKTR